MSAAGPSGAGSEPATDDTTWSAGLRAHPRSAALLVCPELTLSRRFAHAFETREGELEAALPRPIARLHQVHGNDVLRLPASPATHADFLEPQPERRPAGDALISDLPGFTVAVSVADCLPILVADPDTGAVAAVHGGWRPLAGGIVEASLEAMTEAFGSDPARCLVAIGPGIGPCCYEVGDEVVEALDRRGYDVRVDRGPGRRPHADLLAAARAALRSSGVAGDRVFVAEVCTRCHGDVLWSFRRDGDAAGRMLCGIARLG